MVILFAFLSGSARQIEEMPQVLPLLLGFLVALFLLNLGISLIRKKAGRDNKKEAASPEKKQLKP
ncbi:hypothetical protein CLNEO_01870 [Anaerotignum neopropionicum]|uniref:Uncharacterized protein n=1 Tax=Anaerotignum neopropionicum TaxID=36847 RepID=A0A136WHU1_9FIRM|nr:hypothetical protein [Anaerotignum neopropionicum]KXL54091.1 hypothetical protein CLNEO_01870 [Anaerotignum neopropionicum]